MKTCPFSWDRPTAHISPDDEDKPIDVEGNSSIPHTQEETEIDLKDQLEFSSDDGFKSDVDTH